MFFPQEGVLALKARRIVQMVLDDIGLPNTEVFPKQDRLTGHVTFGNFIFAPLFGRLVPQGRTVFVDPFNGLAPYQNQWAVLEQVERFPAASLDEILELNEADCGGASPQTEVVPHSITGAASFGLPPCAQRMLAEGVTENQRKSCFRLALQIKKARLPEYAATASLMVWAGRNRPKAGKSIITPMEIAKQTADAYARDYRSCGCEDEAVKPFCSEACWLRNHSYSQPQESEGEQATPYQSGRNINDA